MGNQSTIVADVCSDIKRRVETVSAEYKMTHRLSLCCPAIWEQQQTWPTKPYPKQKWGKANLFLFITSQRHLFLQPPGEISFGNLDQLQFQWFHCVLNVAAAVICVPPRISDWQLGTCFQEKHMPLLKNKTSRIKLHLTAVKARLCFWVSTVTLRHWRAHSLPHQKKEML